MQRTQSSCNIFCGLLLVLGLLVSFAISNAALAGAPIERNLPASPENVVVLQASPSTLTLEVGEVKEVTVALQGREEGLSYVCWDFDENVIEVMYESRFVVPNTPCSLLTRMQGVTLKIKLKPGRDPGSGSTKLTMRGYLRHPDMGEQAVAATDIPVTWRGTPATPAARTPEAGFPPESTRIYLTAPGEALLRLQAMPDGKRRGVFQLTIPDLERPGTYQFSFQSVPASTLVAFTQAAINGNKAGQLVAPSTSSSRFSFTRAYEFQVTTEASQADAVLRIDYTGSTAAGGGVSGTKVIRLEGPPPPPGAKGDPIPVRAPETPSPKARPAPGPATPATIRLTTTEPALLQWDAMADGQYRTVFRLALPESERTGAAYQMTFQNIPARTEVRFTQNAVNGPYAEQPVTLLIPSYSLTTEVELQVTREAHQPEAEFRIAYQGPGKAQGTKVIRLAGVPGGLPRLLVIIISVAGITGIIVIVLVGYTASDFLHAWWQEKKRTRRHRQPVAPPKPSLREDVPQSGQQDTSIYPGYGEAERPGNGLGQQPGVARARNVGAEGPQGEAEERVWNAQVRARAIATIQEMQILKDIKELKQGMGFVRQTCDEQFPILRKNDQEINRALEEIKGKVSSHEESQMQGQQRIDHNSREIRHVQERVGIIEQTSVERIQEETVSSQIADNELLSGFFQAILADEARIADAARTLLDKVFAQTDVSPEIVEELRQMHDCVAAITSELVQILRLTLTMGGPVEGIERAHQKAAKILGEFRDYERSYRDRHMELIVPISLSSQKSLTILGSIASALRTAMYKIQDPVGYFTAIVDRLVTDDLIRVINIVDSVEGSEPLKEHVKRLLEMSGLHDTSPQGGRVLRRGLQYKGRSISTAHVGPGR